MADSYPEKPRLVETLRWIAHVWGVGALLFWGAFFLEHLAWFRDPRHLPPPDVFLTMGLHLAMLLSLALAWRWEIVGGVCIIATTIAFFARAGGPSFPVFSALTGLPGLLYLIVGILSRPKDDGFRSLPTDGAATK